MTAEHDYAIYDTPIRCRNCHRTMESIRGDFFPKICTSAPPESGGNVEVEAVSAPSRHRLEDMLDDGSLARRVAEIRAQEGRA